MAKKDRGEHEFEVGDHREAARRISCGEDELRRLTPCAGRSHWRFFRGDSSCSRDAMEFSLRQDWLDKALGKGEPLAKVQGGKPEAVIHALKFRGRTIVVQTRLIEDAYSWEKSCDVRWGVAAPRAVKGRSAATIGATKDFWAEFCFRMKAALAEEPEKFAAKMESSEISKAAVANGGPSSQRRLRI